MPPFHRLHRLHRLHELHRLGHVADPVLDWTDDFTRRLRGRHPGRPYRRRPSMLTLLLAGLAVFAFVKLTAAASRSNRSTAEKVVLGALLLAVTAWVMSFRRRRYW